MTTLTQDIKMLAEAFSILFKPCSKCLGLGDRYADGRGCNSCRDTGVVPNRSVNFSPLYYARDTIPLLLEKAEKLEKGQANDNP